jgi:hypothetical protein
MKKVPHSASYFAVGFAATASSADLPSIFRTATASRTERNMSRNSVSRLLPPMGPCPGIMVVLSVTAWTFSSAARIIPSMLPPVE